MDELNQQQPALLAFRNSLSRHGCNEPPELLVEVWGVRERSWLVPDLE
jgi:hypothetical protein